MMELVVVLAVIAILATLITPIITSYVDKAKIEKAQNDVRNIATALLQYNTDTKTFPIFVTPADYPNGAALDVIASQGNDPLLAGGVSGWISSNAGSIQSLLNENSLLLTTSGGGAWNGPYLGSLGDDPWGTKYLVNSSALKPGSGVIGFVISAGPNRTVETVFNQSRGGKFTVGGDDIVAVIR